MKYSMLLLLGLSFSLNAFADLKVSDADGWKLNFVKNDKMFQYIVPGADYALTRELDKNKDGESDGMTLTIRKLVKQSDEELAGKKSAWLHAIFSAEKLKKVRTSEERQSVLKVDGQWRYVAELDYDTGTETPLSEAIAALQVNGDLYLVMYEHRGQTYRRNRTEASPVAEKDQNRSQRRRNAGQIGINIVFHRRMVFKSSVFCDHVAQLDRALVS